MRLLLLAICLLIPAASAQTTFDVGDLGIEQADAIPSLLPYESGAIDLDMAYDCGTTDTTFDVLRVHFNATARQRTSGALVPVDQAGVLLVDLDDCGPSTGYRIQKFDARISWTIGDFDAADVLDVEIIAWAEAGEGATYRQTDAVSVSRSVPMLVEPVTETESVREPLAETQTSQEQLAPGPALPLLAAGLLALARRR